MPSEDVMVMQVGLSPLGVAVWKGLEALDEVVKDLPEEQLPIFINELIELLKTWRAK